MKYYCHHCEKEFDRWAVGHTGSNTVCAGGCNTSKKEILDYAKQSNRDQTNN